MEQIIPEENNFWFKLVMFMTALLLFTIVMQNIPKKRINVESFENASFELKTHDDIYDNFYVSVYDSLVYSKKKNKFELTAIITSTKMNSKSNVLEILLIFECYSLYLKSLYLHSQFFPVNPIGQRQL